MASEVGFEVLEFLSREASVLKYLEHLGAIELVSVCVVDITVYFLKLDVLAFDAKPDTIQSDALEFQNVI